MIMKACFWLTLLFLASVLAVCTASFTGALPALNEIGSASYGLGLSLFWLIGFIAMAAHIIGMIVAMIRARHWLWLAASFFLAPLTTLYYYWFVYRL